MRYEIRFFRSPEQIQAHTDAGGALKSLWGEALRRAMGQTNPAPARAPEGEMPIGEAHGRPPDLPDLQAQGSTVWEPGFVDPKAHVRAHQVRRPVLDEGAHMRPNPWPNLGVVNALHVPPPCHTPVALGAPDEEELPLRAMPLSGEHAAEMPSRTLLEQIRGTHVCKDRRPSPDVDARAHPITEQDAQAASAALLEGEEKRTLSMSSQQAAAPGTPLTSNTPSSPLTATPADSEATPQLRTRKRTHTLTPSCIEHDAHSGGTVHVGINAPCFAHGLQAPGAFAKAPDEAGGVTTEGDSVRAPLKDPDDAEFGNDSRPRCA